MAKKIQTPLTEKVVKQLKIGDEVLISGVIYTARDAAHKKLIEMIENGETPPFDIKNQIIYYVGPAPARPGKPIGPAGPTTSYRMDPYTPFLLDRGLKGMIGKGKRGKEVIDSMQKNVAVYFAALGGCAALISGAIKKAEVIAFPELGAEAIRRLEVEDFPAIVVNDCYGQDLYMEGMKAYSKI